MKINLLLIIFLFLGLRSFSKQKLDADSLQVIKLNNRGYLLRLTNPEQTISHGLKALKLSEKLRYQNGIAEACRVIGIGYYYVDKTDSAIAKYLQSLNLFKANRNLHGQAKVLNNIGNLYRDVDYDKALTYFSQSLKLAKQLKIRDLEAGSYLNIGIIFYKHQEYHKALRFFKTSQKLFELLNIPIGITQSLQNQGVIYQELNDLKAAKKYLLEADRRAKMYDLNHLVGSINLTLFEIYLQENNYELAKKSLAEGVTYAEKVKAQKLRQDFYLKAYILEDKKKNYKQALAYLKEYYKQDSITYKKLESKQISLLQEQQKQLEKEQKTQLQLERQKKAQLLFWYSLAVLFLSIIVIFLLIVNVKKKAKTNRQLKLLNEEVLLQKENLDRINRDLEAIIEERTNDLKTKNRKLSEYSSHLSHEIRSPVATLKGLMLLQKENLIDNEELMTELVTCINNLDDKILNINYMLHNPQYKGLHYEPSKDKQE